MARVKTVSPKAELVVLRGMCHKNKAIAGSIRASVDDSFFDSPESKEILSSISKQMAETGEPPVYKMVLQDPDISVEARSFFRDSEAQIQTKEDAVKAVSILNRYRQNRGIYEIGLAVESALQSGKVQTDEVLDDLSRRLSEARSSKANKNEFTHFGVGSNGKSEIHDLLFGDKSENVIPTRIKAFDSRSGGFLRGGLVTVGASSGGGKSLMATQLAINFAEQGYKVAIVPLEMTKAEMEARLMANINGIDVTRILTGKLTDAEKESCWLKYQRWNRRIKKRGGRLTIYKPESDVSIEDVFASLAAYDCDIRIIDYISLLKGADADDAWQKLGAIARLAKVNAGDKYVNVLLCQVNDEGKIRYARAISEHSNNSWIWIAKKEEREKNVGRIKVEQPKARNSASFPFEVGFDWATMRVVDIESVPDTSSESHEQLADLADV